MLAALRRKQKNVPNSPQRNQKRRGKKSKSSAAGNSSTSPLPPKVARKATPRSSEGAYDLRSIKVGRRVAMSFGDGKELKFGEVEKCNVSRAVLSEWDFRIGLDDGQTFEVDCDEMRKALATYDRLHREEMADPATPATKAAIATAFQIKMQLVLGMLSAQYKSQFLEPGFARWEDEFLPVLFVGPYDISEGPLRDIFLRKIKNASKGLLPLPRLVYWYGVDELEQAFSFVPQEDCSTYEEGASKGLLELPKDLQIKLDRGRAFTNTEKKRIEGRDLMEEDKEKDKEDRRRFEKFKEDHQYILDGERLIVEIQSERGHTLLEWGI